jgi:hypothetical protein
MAGRQWPARLAPARFSKTSSLALHRADDLRAGDAKGIEVNAAAKR